MSIEENKAIVRRLLEQGLVRGNQAIGEELLADDFVDHNPLPGLPPNRDGFKQSFVVFGSAFPDFEYRIEDMIGEGDKVVARFTAMGTHKGEMAGIPPTGNRVSVTGIDIFRVTGGKIAEFWLSWDQLGMMQQIGVIPAPSQT